MCESDDFTVMVPKVQRTITDAIRNDLSGKESGEKETLSFGVRRRTEMMR